MAANLGSIWKYNAQGRNRPFKFPALFGAGASQAIKQGELLDLSSGTAVPLASDKAMTAIIAIADCEIRSGDLAGYHDVIVPAPGDVFELPISAAAAPAFAAPLYYNSSQQLATSGTNILGYCVDPAVFPSQGFQSVNPSYDAGTTLRTTSNILFEVKQAASWFAALFI